MSPDQDFEEKERERKVRRRAFHLTFAILALISGGFLIWKFKQSRPANYRWRVIGFFIPSRQRAI